MAKLNFNFSVEYGKEDIAALGNILENILDKWIAYEEKRETKREARDNDVKSYKPVVKLEVEEDKSVDEKPVTEYEKKCKEWLELYDKYWRQSNKGNLVTMFRSSYDSELKKFCNKFRFTTDYLAKINPELFNTAADIANDIYLVGIDSDLVPSELEHKFARACSNIKFKLIHG